MEVQGKIKLIDETKTFGNNGFRKRELVITTEEQYPQHIMIEFVQDKTELLNNFQVGQNVKVSINLRGREWTNPQGEVKLFQFYPRLARRKCRPIGFSKYATHASRRCLRTGKRSKRRRSRRSTILEKQSL
jgi:hypothetical protein